MPLSTSISLPPDVQGQINSYAMQYGVDSIIASALAQVISGGNQSFAQGEQIGVMGISVETGSMLGFDVTVQSQNIQAGVLYLSTLVSQFVGKYALAVAAYMTSPGLVLTSNGIPPITNIQNIVYNVTSLAQRAGSSLVSTQRTIQAQTTMDPEPVSSATQNLIDKQTKGLDYGSTNASNTALLAASLTPVLQDDTGLDETAWWQDDGLVTGNPRVRQQVQPVQFMVYLDQNNPKQFLHKPNTNIPITLQLNTSLREFQLESKHVYVRTPSRTGQHVTFWGMQPDLIQGSGSTGVFMNQFGITDFMSVAGIGEDVKTLLVSGFSHSFQSNRSAASQTSTGEVFTNSVTAQGVNGQDVVYNNILGKQKLAKPEEAFRVAAQDAFMEFMKLFQMNGNVWYHTDNYQGVFTEQEQQSPNAWSPKVGATTIQQHSRNNDVMTRGYVAMKYRNNVYLGYFKSLNWTQDANKPFSWDFSFVFQVERTYTSLFWPKASAAVNT